MQNAISGLDLSKNSNKKYEILETEESSNILPAQIDFNSLDPTLLPASEEFPQFDKINDRRNAFSAESEEVKTKGFLPPPTGFQPPRLLPSHNNQHRAREEERLKNLGLPLQAATQATRTKSQSLTRSIQSGSQTTKKPTRTFDPDKNFAAFDHFFPSVKATHKDYDFSKYLVRKDGSSSPTTRRPATRRQNLASRFSNQLPVGPPATQRPSAFNQFKNTQKATTKVTTTTKRPTQPSTTPRVVTTTKKASIATTKKPLQVTRSQPNFNQQVTKPPTVPVTQKTRVQPVIGQQRSKVSKPSTELEPPLQVLRIYDDATTKGPPIYYEWKVPDDGLVPPKFDNDSDLNALKRSVLEEGNFDGTNDFQSSESRRLGSGNSIKIQYKDLQKLFAIPEIQFPLETTGRDGYDKADAVNSFQVKIPYRTGTAKSPTSDRYYYLEHSHCNPECHPYFFKPNRCEPCIKLK